MRKMIAVIIFGMMFLVIAGILILNFQRPFDDRLTVGITMEDGSRIEGRIIEDR